MNHRLREASELGAQRQRTLGVLDAFFEAAAGARAGGLQAAASAVATSALAALDASRVLVVVPAEDAGVAMPRVGHASEWILVETGGVPTRHLLPEARVAAAWPPSPNQLAALAGEPDLADLRPMVLRETAGGGEEAVAVVFSDGGPGGSHVSTVSAAWRSALRAAAGRERADRAGERLAVANRRLEATSAAMAGREADARLREIAAGAAHEMNNPLAVISGRTEQLALRLDGETLPLVKAAHQASGRLAELVAALGMFARPPVARRRPVDAARVAAEAVEAVRASRPLRREQMEPLEVSLRPGPGLEAVEVDETMLRQTLDELITNAAQAHPKSFLSVKLFLEEPDDAAGTEASALVVEVCDDGTGLDERTLQHAADPFFSRHPAGRRAGLGLSRVALWTAAHSGDLQLRHGAGGGLLRSGSVSSDIVMKQGRSLRLPRAEGPASRVSCRDRLGTAGWGLAFFSGGKNADGGSRRQGSSV